MSPETYVNHASILALAVLFPVLAIFAVSGRIWARSTPNLGLGVDDHLSIAATVLLIGCSIDILVGTTYKIPLVGYHSSPNSTTFSSTTFSIPGIRVLDKVKWSYDMLWYCGVALVKLSILFFYRRIFRGKTFNVVSWGTIALVAMWGVAFFCTLFQCGTHFDVTWGEPLPEFLNPRCVDSLMVFFVNSLFSCFLDFVILLMPMPFIWRLKLRTREKLGLTAVFSLGSLCVGASAIRLAMYSKLCWWQVWTGDSELSVLGLSRTDVFGIVSLALFWSQIEFGVATFACCLPCLGPLARTRAFKSLATTVSSISARHLARRFNRTGVSSIAIVKDSTIHEVNGPKRSRSDWSLSLISEEESSGDVFAAGSSLQLCDMESQQIGRWDPRVLEDGGIGAVGSTQ